MHVVIYEAMEQVASRVRGKCIDTMREVYVTYDTNI